MSKKNSSRMPLNFERDELIGIFVCLVLAIGFFVVLRFEEIQGAIKRHYDAAIIKEEKIPDMVFIDTDNNPKDVQASLAGAFSAQGEVKKLIVEDSVVGTGAEVVEGSRVTVHYIGALQDGTEFDNSYARGEAFSFTVGGGTVIKGWDTGLIGMKEGGKRLLVIPSNLAYGDSAVGPIPKGSTLLFSIELIAVK